MTHEFEFLGSIAMHENATIRKSFVFGGISGMNIKVQAIIRRSKPANVDGILRSRMA